jgi:hypothetical protein
VFSDGCAYDGEWKADVFNGRGILSLASGSVYVAPSLSVFL